MTQPRSPKEMASLLHGLFQQQGGLLTKEQLEALRERIDRVVNYQAVVGIMGKTGAGKSSLCNALFGQDVAEVNDIAACTRNPQEYTLAYKNGRGIALIDLPGVGENEERDAEYAALYRELLPELDLVLWLVKADDRALRIDEQFYQTLVRPHMQQRGIPLLLVLTQADKLEPCREWDEHRHLPGLVQQRNISDKQILLSRLFDVPLSQLCVTAAKEGYGLGTLIEQIVHFLPNEKKWSITREARWEAVTSQARQASVQGLWESVKSAAAELLKEGWQRVSSALSSLASSLLRSWW